MSLLRGLVLLAFAVTATSALAPTATAGPRPTCTFLGTLVGDHVAVHWNTDEASQVACPNPSEYHQPEAGETLAAAEAAYDLWVTKRGFPPPVDDGDGKLDVYVYDTSPAAGIFDHDGPGGPGTWPAWVALTGDEAKQAHWVGTAVFYASTMAMWGVWQDWFTFGTAEWAGLTAGGFPEFASLLQAPDIALDCYDTPCAETLFLSNGQARWPFFQYLTDRFGNDVVRDVWERVAARAGTTADGVGALGDVLAAKGTTLTDVFNDFTGATAAGAVNAPNIAGDAPTTFATMAPGVAVGTKQVQKVAVNHLSARFVKLVPGSGAGGVCFPATLTVEVALPAGTGARPSFYAKDYGGLKAFTVAGSTATLVTPWDTCTWTDRAALVGLPNPSTTADGQEFTVTTTITGVDLTTIVSPDAPAEPKEPRPTVPTAGAVPPPVLTFHGPATVPVARDGGLTLAFFASNRGSVEIEAAGKRLKTVKVRAGRNVVKLRLPGARTAKGTRANLASRPARLVLTAVSPTGEVGRTVSRRLRYVR
ncbi:MAG: hypothetical protein ACM33B_11960 [Pseudomonadota bacterium]